MTKVKCKTIYTIGHSTHSLDEFITLICHYHITFVADVRAFPYSRRNRDYNGNVLPEALGKVNVIYRHFPELGGRRPRSRTVAPTINAFWRVQSFHNYADYALSDKFQNGLATLIEASRYETVVLTCAEVLWWRCHRRIISDYLLSKGLTVIHILSLTNTQEGVLTPGAVVAPTGCLTYPLPESVCVQNDEKS
ncbi:DUF488 domain-containing protein [Acetobacter sp.]|jgi:uncharacterized protein (DUF488 family)|uniref:DUF488 domain-containing protein n=1 Tax=Acetobacter sp. TaxID=440 RepID=UPI0025C48FB5|nr:DUF488 domain-containing protein [Acetobacter sp.]MCH4091186.1 DUF488 domain-containing protein [Acetobacter sp.]